MKDEGRSLEVGFQERASNHPKLLRLRAVVVSVGVKAPRPDLGQVRIRETNESEPSDDASLSYLSSKPGAFLSPGTSLSDT